MHPEYDPHMTAFSDAAIAGMAEAAERRGNGATPVPASRPEPDPMSIAVRGLTEDDQQRFRRAIALETAGDVQKAWAEAEPLFAAYPKHFAVHELRCRLALARGGSWVEVRKECAVFPSDGGR
jgi:hypothetical protein